MGRDALSIPGVCLPCVRSEGGCSTDDVTLSLPVTSFLHSLDKEFYVWSRHRVQRTQTTLWRTRYMECSGLNCWDWSWASTRHCAYSNEVVSAACHSSCIHPTKSLIRLTRYELHQRSSFATASQFGLPFWTNKTRDYACQPLPGNQGVCMRHCVS